MRRAGTRLALVSVLAMTSLGIVTARAVDPPGAPADRFLAYKTKTTKGTAKFTPRRGVTLAGDFESLSVDVKTAGDLLVPAAVAGGTVADAATHLRAYAIKPVKGAPKHRKRLRLSVVSHLGTLVVDTVKADLLLVPTALDGAVSPPPPEPALHDVDHYRCYRVRPSKRAAKLPKGLRVTATDPFTGVPRVLAVRALKRLCLPVDKNLEGVKHPGGALACYTVTRAKGEPKPVAVRALQMHDQFGPLALDALRESELCMPSVVLVPSPTPVGGQPTPTPTAGGPTATATALPIPPDPAEVAPPVDPSVASLPAVTTAFLHAGADPIQRGVAPGTIRPERASVVRGRVLDRDGAALPGVVVTVRDRPELGLTVSRADGGFDLAVNGGGTLTVDYEKTGFLPAQRQVDVPWQDFVSVPDVVLVTRDAQVTAVDLTAAVPMQAARGSVVSDADGTRRATLLFGAGTAAEVMLPGGGTEPVETLHVRLTEYTVGANGPRAMPGSLPPTSGYTYAVELSADEAPTKVGGKDVVFNQPVFFYVENFLDFPTGTTAPMGFYDRDTASWIPSDNGRVIAIVGVTGGEAELDTDGDGAADEGGGLDVSGAERRQLASLYQVGQSLWRVPITHFSTWDCNWPFAPPADATAAGTAGAESEESVDQCADEAPAASVIECQDQVLGETVAVVGTPFTLNYRSDRVPGRKAAYSASIALSGPSVPASLKRIDLDVTVGGRRFVETFPASADQRTRFTWDGIDAYGRTLQGSQPLTGSIGFVYDGVYLEPDDVRDAFGQFGQTPILGSRTREEVTVLQPLDAAIGVWDARAAGLGGWTLSAHHAYDLVRRTLHLGDGGRLAANVVTGTLATRAGGGALATVDAEGVPARDVALEFSTLTNTKPLSRVAVGPDGSVYFAESTWIRRIDRNGILTTFAGIKGASGFDGDGGPATEALLSRTGGIAFGPDGSLYFADVDNRRIRRIDRAGEISTVAGTTFGSSDDDIPATEAALVFPVGLAFAPDGSLYIVDLEDHRVRRVDPAGMIGTVAGTAGIFGYEGDGGLATAALLRAPADVAIGLDGSVYVADFGNQVVRRIDPSGIITTAVGTGLPGAQGDGGPADQATLFRPQSLAAGRDGTLYVGHLDDAGPGDVVRRVGTDGVITTLAGGGSEVGEDVPATQGFVGGASGLALGPDGTVYVVGDNVVQSVRTPLPDFQGAAFAVASPDGGLLYRFDAAGRHLETRDALTGARRFAFGYDAGGRLATVADGEGNTTTIERDANGHPTAIVAPFGQRTILALDANGFLASLANPAGEAVSASYTADGLLERFTDARLQTSTYEYDDLGRLTLAEDPAGGSHTIARTELPNGHEITRTTALGRTSTYRVERLPAGEQSLTTTTPDGRVTRIDLQPDGSVLTETPDGTRFTTVLGPDPRFGMQAPVVIASTLTTPGGRTETTTRTRTASLADPDDPLSLAALTTTVVRNGRTFTRHYDRASSTITDVTPAGRGRVTVLDALGRPVSDQRPGEEPVTLAYDDRGRVTTVSQGSGPVARVAALAYDDEGFLAEVAQPEGATSALAVDAAGRVTDVVLPGNRTVAFAYDANGNATSVTPPGRPAHHFTYDAVDLIATHAAPDAGSGPATTVLARDLDRALTTRTLPDGTTIALGYDAASGRLVGQTLAEGAITYGFDAATRHLATVGAPGNVTVAYANDGALPIGIAWSGPVAGTVTRTFDDDLRTAALAVNDDPPVVYGYDADGFVVAAGALGITRDPATGRVSATALGDVADTWEYDAFGELVRYTASFGATPLFDVQLARDRLGRVVERTATVEGAATTRRYVYDAALRLAAVRNAADQALAAYAYDDNGNRTSVTTAGGTTTATYDAQDRLLQRGGVSHEYDAAGQLARETLGAAITDYAYDAAGNLRAVTLPNGTAIEYVIDGVNRRIGKRVNGTVVQGWLYQDRFRPAAELDGAGNVVARFVYALHRHVPAYVIKGGSVFRIVSDPLGSPRLVVDVATGTVAQRLDYDEFGVVTEDSNPGFQPFGFAGGLYDPDTRLVRFGARDYAAESGRWIARDPAFGLEQSLYAYASNDPVNRIDPLGRTDNEWEDWLTDGIDEVTGTGARREAFDRKETQVFDPDTVIDLARRRMDEIVKERRIRELFEKVDTLAKKIPGPTKICLFVATAAGLSERAEANEQSVVEQAAEEAFLPVEGKTISETLTELAGAVKDAIQGAFEPFAQRRI